MICGKPHLRNSDSRSLPPERPPDPESRSPGAVTALGASELDQLGRKVFSKANRRKRFAQALVRAEPTAPSDPQSQLAPFQGLAVPLPVGAPSENRCRPAHSAARVIAAATYTLVIEHLVTVDMDDGQPLPPYIDDDVIWSIVRQADGHTLWRRIFLRLKPNGGAQARRAADC
jgi:hypothetical protein